MIKEAIEKIEAMAATQTFEVDGSKYTSKGLFPLLDPQPCILKIDTLTGFIDYIQADIDKLPIPDGLLVHILDHLNVFLISSLTGGFRQRSTYILATTRTAPFPFGQFMDVESFIIGMQSMFVQDEATADILKIVGNVGDGWVRTFADDGVTQQATVKTGVSRMEDIKVPNPVELAPYRTFLEIEQPKSKFVFRMRSGEKAPTCALFEADGGAWKNEVIVRIREWLKERVRGISIIA
jgi:hypothetical protein